MTTSKSPDAPASADGGLDRRVLMIAGVVVLGAIMSILDMTIVGVAQNTFQKEWDVEPATAAWTVTGYTLALAAVIPVTGWAADRFGTKRLYLMSVVLFTIGSVLCAVADSIEMLIAFRVVQGLGGGMLMPLGMAILTKAAGPERVGRVMAVLGIPMLLGPIGGPILGGWLIEIASWHWIFLINLPIGVLALVYSYIVLPTDEPSPSERFDIVGFALLSPGLAAFLYGISVLPEEGTVTAPKVLIPVIVGAILIIAFVFWALRAKIEPLLDLRLFKNRNMSVAMITFSMFAIAFFGAMLLYTQYFIGVRAETTLMAGLLMAPQGLGAMVTMPVAGALTDKMGPGKFVLSGIVLIVIGMAVFTQLDAETSYLLIEASLFMQGLGMGMTMMPIMTSALRTLTPDKIARGSTLTNIVQQIAASVGTAVITVILTSQLKSGEKLPIPPGEESSLKQLAIGANMADDEAEKAQIAGALDSKGGIDHAMDLAAGAFGNTYLVAIILVALCAIPAFFLPRSRQEMPEGAAPVLMH